MDPLRKSLNRTATGLAERVLEPSAKGLRGFSNWFSSGARRQGRALVGKAAWLFGGLAAVRYLGIDVEMAIQRVPAPLEYRYIYMLVLGAVDVQILRGRWDPAVSVPHARRVARRSSRQAHTNGTCVLL